MPPDVIPTVLVTGAGGPSGVAVMESLRGAGVRVLAGDIDPYAAGLYLVDEADRLLLPRGDAPQFAAVLLEHCRREQVAVVVPTVDSELLPLAEQRDAYAAAGVRLALAPHETLLACLDKWRLHERCEGTVRVPWTLLLDADFDPSAVELPVIVKPRVGSGSRGIHLIERPEQFASLERDGSLLVQEHLPGAEHSLDVLVREDGEVLAVVPRVRLKVDSGIAVTGRTVRDEALVAFGRAVAERIGLRGVANVQVRQAVGGEPALLEVNPRVPGTMPLTVAAGVDMPRLWVDEALGQPMPDGPLAFEELAMVRYLEQRFFGVDELQRAEAQRHA